VVFSFWFSAIAACTLDDTALGDDPAGVAVIEPTVGGETKPLPAPAEEAGEVLPAVGVGDGVVVADAVLGGAIGVLSTFVAVSVPVISLIESEMSCSLALDALGSSSSGNTP